MARIVVITGAGAGVGRAAADAFAAKGYDVALLSRDPDRLEQAAGELRLKGVRALALPTDVADADAVERAADRVEQELGPIDIWVNVAMATVFAPVSRLTAAEFQRGTQVTYLGQVHGTMAALSRMRVRNRGTIVNVGSALAYRSVPLQSIYCGAKAAIRGFTDSLRSEIIHDKLDIHLTTVDLPAVNTPQFRRARNYTGAGQNAPDPVFDPRACAAAIMAAVTDPQREIWVGRSVLQMLAVQALAPGFGDRQAARMWDAQLDRAVEPASPGNLHDVDEEDPGIDGPFGDRTRAPRREYVTSRSRDAVSAVLGIPALLGAGAVLAPLALAIGLGATRRV